MRILVTQVCGVFAAEGAFKKLKPEPNSGLSTVSTGITSPGSGLSTLSQHAGHTPTTASCPTPARRRHRTTFTQVSFPPSRLSLFPLPSSLFSFPFSFYLSPYAFAQHPTPGFPGGPRDLSEKF